MSAKTPTPENPVVSVLCKLRDGTLTYVAVNEGLINDLGGIATQQYVHDVVAATAAPKRKVTKNG